MKNRGRRGILAVMIPVGALSTMLTAVLAIAVNAATEQVEPWPYCLEVLRRHSFGSVLAINVALVLLGAVVLWLTHRGETLAGDDPAPPAPPVVPGWVVERPDELHALVQRLTTGRTVGITTALHGAGGFGKTTLAAVVCRDRRVQKRFRGRVYRVTLGRDLRERAALAAKVCDLAELITGERAALEDVRLAGEHLGRVLDARPPVLLVIDDVWDRAQLEPFLSGGARCVRLVTTRSPSTLPEHAAAVPVDQLSRAQARRILLWELPPVSGTLVNGLLDTTGQWPLLLRLVNRMLVDLLQAGAAAEDATAEVLARLRRLGPAAADTGHVDLNIPEQRALAVRATIDASRSLMPDDDQQRLAELGVFAEDEAIPVDVVLALWRRTGGLDKVDGRRLCRRLADLALIQLSAHAGGHVTVHDVVRDFLLHELGTERTRELHGALLDAFPAPWWALPADARYLWGQAVWHHVGAGRVVEAELLTTDLRWVGARLLRDGPYAPLADLAAVGTPRTDAARRVLQQAAHLLAPTEPEHALTDLLHLRVGEDPVWAAPAVRRPASAERPRLDPTWPLPDTRAPFDRVLDGQRATDAMVVAPNGQWWVSAGDRVCLWDTTRMQVRAFLVGHVGAVCGVAVAPDSTWVATAGRDSRVGIWDAGTGALRTWLLGHPSGVRAVAVTPDAERLITGGGDGLVRIWEVSSGRCVAELAGHRGAVHGATAGPDGDWFATAGSDGTIRVWGAVSLAARAVLRGHTGTVHQVVAAVDGTSLISAGDRTVRRWECATWSPAGELVRHSNPITGVAMPSHGRWVATVGDGGIQLWDKTGRRLAPPTDRRPWVNAVAVFDDEERLAIGYADDTVQLVDARPARPEVTPPPHARLATSLTLAPDGRTVGSAGDGEVLLWEASSAALVATFPSDARALRFKPDGGSVVVVRDAGVVFLDRRGERHITVPLVISATDVIDLTPDASWLVAADETGVRHYRLPDGARIGECEVDMPRLSTVLAHPDGDRVVLGSIHALQVVSIAARRPQWSTGPARVSAAGLAPGGDLLVVGFVDSSLAGLDVSTGAERWSTARDARSDAGQITAIAFAGDGTWFAATGNDGSVWVRDAATGRCRTMSRADGPLWCCAVSADGGRLAVGGGRGITMFTVATDR